MPFPQKLLADHERIVFDLKPHWVALIPMVLWTFFLVALWVVGYRVAGNQLDDPNLAQNVIAVACLLGIFFLTGVPFMRWSTTHFVLTTDRLITRSGVIAKSSREIPLERINDVAFNQSALERMLGAGDLLVESAGERGQSRITNVRRPEEVQLMIYKETEENNNRMMGGGRPQVAAQPEGVTDQLEALGRLKEQGVLSETEFESKKQELLKRL
ncbi:MAG: PH domain-containing protein [Actinobacteria bacterium]|nr:PH domain-containing protein [Actinomycetota bacterium]